MIIKMTVDKEADAVYLYLSKKKVAYSKELDAERIADYSDNGELRGIEFLSVSSGVNTNDLPHKAEIEKALRDKGIRAFA